MPIKYIDDNIFSSSAVALVNPVNAMGVSGKGLALHFRYHFPENFKAYKNACDAGLLSAGNIFVYENDVDSPTPRARFIVNLATKDKWWYPSKLEWLGTGLLQLREWSELNFIESLAIPALGAGLGGLPWESVKREIEECFYYSKSSVEVYAPLSPLHGARRSSKL